MELNEDNHNPTQQSKLKLFEIQKQIQHVKQLIQRNQVLSDKLKKIQNKITAKIKHNDSILSTFRYRRVRAQNIKEGISGISFYNYETQPKIPPCLENLLQLQGSKEKSNVFLKKIYQDEDQMTPNSNFVSQTETLKEKIKTYPTNPSSIPFDKIGKFYHVTGLQVFKLWRKEKFEPIPQKIPFSPEEKIQIIQMHNKYGDNWRHMAKLTEFRSSEQMYYQFNVINKQFNKGRWSLVENLKLLYLVEYYQAPNYHKMSLKLKTRSEGQIRERFMNILHPKKRVREWSEEEVELLIKKACDFKYKWAKLSELFEYKDDNEVWRKFRGTMAEKSVEDIQQMVFDAKVRKAILDHKKKYRVQTRAIKNQ